MSRWQDSAACVGMSTDLFFPLNGKSPEARAACARCPVTSECLAYAIEIREWSGIYAGLCGDERRELAFPVRVRSCVTCGGTFKWVDEHDRAKTCSPACRRRLRADQATARRVRRMTPASR